MNLNIPYINSTVNKIEINCATGFGKTTMLQAGGSITLKPGFMHGAGGTSIIKPIPCD